MGEARKRAMRRSADGDSPRATLFAHALELHRRREYAAARQLCERIVASEPAHAGAWQLLGLTSLETGLRESGVEALKRAVALDEHDQSARLNLALALRLVGDLRESAACFDALCTRAPMHAGFRVEHAATLEALGLDESAESAYRQALAIEPRLVVAHCGLARVLYERNAVDEAIAVQRRAATFDPRAIDDGAIGHAHAAPGEASRRAHERAVQACRQTAAPGLEVESLVRERELRVIDDFEPDFDGWRRHALSRSYVNDGSAKDANFPGIETRGGFATPVQMQRIADALGRPIKWRWPAHGAFRLSFADSLARSDIHVDEAICRPMYAGVLYLSRPQDCRGGTSFWRHDATGWSHIPAPDELARSRYRSLLDFQQREVLGSGERSAFDALARQRAAWTRLLEVPMKANRLIVYRSDYFHSISEVFGTTREDARLVQLFFFAPH